MEVSMEKSLESLFEINTSIFSYREIEVRWESRNILSVTVKWRDSDFCQKDLLAFQLVGGL